MLDTMCWRRDVSRNHEKIVGFDAGAVLKDVEGYGDLRTHCLVLQDLDGLMLEEVVRLGGEVSWEHKVVGAGEDDGVKGAGEEGEGRAWVDVEVKGGGKKRVRGDYVVGCDGANSAVRKALFGEVFPGFTWEEQIVATNVGYSSMMLGELD